MSNEISEMEWNWKSLNTTKFSLENYSCFFKLNFQKQSDLVLLLFLIGSFIPTSFAASSVSSGFFNCFIKEINND